MSSRITLSNTASINTILKLGFKNDERDQDAHTAEERACLRLMFPQA